MEKSFLVNEEKNAKDRQWALFQRYGEVLTRFVTGEDRYGLEKTRLARFCWLRRNLIADWQGW